MALFNKKPKATEVVKAPKQVAKKVTKEVKAVTEKVAELTKAVKAGRVGGLEQNMILLRPHITEKATDLSEKNVYAFEIAHKANKMQVRQVIEKFYKVKPIKIAIIMGMPKTMKNPRTGRVQVKKTAIKKALVYLKKGDKIEFV